MTYKDKGSYESSPPGILQSQNESQIYEYMYTRMYEYMYTRIYEYMYARMYEYMNI